MVLHPGRLGVLQLFRFWETSKEVSSRPTSLIAFSASSSLLQMTSNAPGWMMPKVSQCIEVSRDLRPTANRLHPNQAALGLRPQRPLQMHSDLRCCGHEAPLRSPDWEMAVMQSGLNEFPGPGYPKHDGL